MSHVAILAVGTPADGGTFQYTVAMIEALATLRQHRYTVYANDPAPFAHLGIPVAPLPSRGRVLGAWIAHLLDGRKGLFTESDAVIAPRYSLLLFAAARPFAFTLHDLQEHYYPEHFTLAQRVWRRLMHRVLAGHATRVLCESRHVQTDIERFFHVSADRISVIPAPPLGLYQEQSGGPSAAQRRRRLGLPGQYLLYPAQFWAHKNHRRLLDAFALVLARYPDCHLVLTGDRSRVREPVLDNARDMGVGHRVLDLGFVTAADMPAVYSGARAVVIPTLFESISLPMYEAFSLGVPVCASRVVGLPDQAGDGAVLFDPLDPQDIARGIVTVLDDEELRQRLVAEGTRRIRERTQTAYAAQLDAVIGALTSGGTG